MNLNEAQQKAVDSSAPWNIVLAGPGSGKSRVIVEHAKLLVARGVAPSSMGFVTFTNVAARVMRSRLTESVGSVGFVGTLHAMMLGALRRDDNRWTLVGEDDAEEFLQRHVKLLNYKGTHDALAKARNLENSMEQYELRDHSAFRVIRSYQTFMRRENLLDYGMVLTEGLKLLDRERYDGAPNVIIPWTTLYVDEFQDSSPVDAKIYLRINPQNLMVAADADQSVFSFRGARPENVTDYWKNPRFERHLLNLNYRCADKICHLANNIIGESYPRIEKETVSATDEAGEVELLTCASESAEREQVAETISGWIMAGANPEEIAVLCRTNKLANEIRAHLIRHQFKVSDVVSDGRPKDWKLLSLLFSMMASPNSWAVARLLTRALAKNEKRSLAGAESALEAGRKALPDAIPANSWAFPKLEVILTLNADFSRYGISKATQKLFNGLIRLHEPTSLDELLDMMRSPPEAEIQSGIEVGTIHSAKGNEWRRVVIAGADLFKRENEDFRLLFVAITRAKSELVITESAERTFTLPNGRIVVTPGELFLQGAGRTCKQFLSPIEAVA